MLVRTFTTAATKALFVRSPSREIVAAHDGMGHRLYDSEIPAGMRDMPADRAGEQSAGRAFYCLSGYGMIAVDGIDYLMTAGTLVAAPTHRRVEFEARAPMRVLTVIGAEPAQDRVIVRSLDEVIGTSRDVFWGNGQSRRLIVRDDGTGFAVCVTRGNANSRSALQYRRHLESCYYFAGSGEYVWDGGSHPIRAKGGEATAFIMNDHDAHEMVIAEESTCLSIFSPAIEGHESHALSAAASSSY